jgi:hypothetical protein
VIFCPLDKEWACGFRRNRFVVNYPTLRNMRSAWTFLFCFYVIISTRRVSASGHLLIDGVTSNKAKKKTRCQFFFLVAWRWTAEATSEQVTSDGVAVGHWITWRSEPSISRSHGQGVRDLVLPDSRVSPKGRLFWASLTQDAANADIDANRRRYVELFFLFVLPGW